MHPLVPENLEDIYIDELRDLWSANDQMEAALPGFIDRISDRRVRHEYLEAQKHIAKHTQLLKKILVSLKGDVPKPHCKAMEGLVHEATKHILDKGLEPGPVLDVIIIAQYQRMTHYGIAGFGTAAAYATALDRDKDITKLALATLDLYKSDSWMTRLAERSVNLRARAKAA